MNAHTHIEAANPLALVAAEQVQAIVARELSGARWSASARAELFEIKMLAIGVADYFAGHDGFEDAPEQLDAAIVEWSERADYRTFSDVSLAECGL